jgi:hypothetical protein
VIHRGGRQFAGETATPYAAPVRLLATPPGAEGGFYAKNLLRNDVATLIVTPTQAAPDLQGNWARVSFPGFGRPLTGAGPVINKNRLPDGTPSPYGYVGDYSNPILKLQAAEIVKTHGEIEAGGAHALNPRNECWPTGVPLVLESASMQIIQQPDFIPRLMRFGAYA